MTKRVNGVLLEQLSYFSGLDCPSCGVRLDLSDKLPLEKSECGECGVPFLNVAMLGKRFVLNDKLNETPVLCTFEADDLENDFHAVLKVFDNGRIVDRESLLSELNKIKSDLFFAGGAVSRIVSVGELVGSVFVCRGFAADSLKERLAHDGRLTLTEALGVVRDVADAYYSVAAKGILPALVSPGNILYNDKDELQVSDIGIAEVLYKQAGGRKEMLSDFFPVFYSSPELLDSGQISLAGTIYSLGVLAYELISGNFPYSTQNVDELRKQQGVPCVSLMAAVPGLPDGISELVAEMMAIEPSKRVSSFGKVVERIDKIVETHELYATTEEVLPEVEAVSDAVVQAETLVATPSAKKGQKRAGGKKKRRVSAGKAVAKARPRPVEKSKAPLIIFIFFVLTIAGIYVLVGDLFNPPTPTSIGPDKVINTIKEKPVKKVKKKKKKKKVKKAPKKVVVDEPEDTPEVVEVKRQMTLVEREALRKRIRPANMDFDAMRKLLYKYRDAFPENERQGEILRFEVLTSFREELATKLTPYEGQNVYEGYFYPKGESPFLGALTSISEKDGFDILTNRGTEVTLKWEEVEFQQYAEFMIFLASNKAKDLSLERYESVDFSGIAEIYMTLAVLYDWYDLKKDALATRAKAIQLDPVLENKLDLLIPVE